MVTNFWNMGIQGNENSFFTCYVKFVLDRLFWNLEVVSDDSTSHCWLLRLYWDNTTKIKRKQQKALFNTLNKQIFNFIIGCIVLIRTYVSMIHGYLVGNMNKKLELSSLCGISVINCLGRWAKVKGPVYIKGPKLKETVTTDIYRSKQSSVAVAKINMEL